MTSVAVVGLGKIGLPLAALYAGKGMQVTGCDINPAVVEAVNRGESPVGGEPGLAEAVLAAHQSGTLHATSDTTNAVADSDVVVVMVRVGIDASGHADYHFLDTAANAIGRGLKLGTLVILESTVPVGRDPGSFRQAAGQRIGTGRRCVQGRLQPGARVLGQRLS